jgi:hypothetical protein
LAALPNHANACLSISGQSGSEAIAILPEQLPTAWLCVAMLLFIVKHLVADFFLQTSWMALGKERVEDWLKPLTAHAAIHAIGTLLLCLALAPALIWLAGIDFVVHCAIDRGKGLLGRRFSATPDKTVFWWLLGIDQSLHALTHFLFALALTAAHANA